MKPILFLIGWLFIVDVFEISEAHYLECFSCTDSLSLHECKSVETCEEGQVCFKRREHKGQVQYDMGCIDKESCGKYALRQNSSEIAKMNADIKTSYCYECCSKVKCNENLCIYPPHSLCQDDKSVDCAKLNSMFDICEVTSEAKKICPRYCNLCDLVDGNWSPWSSWTSCDVTCGSGLLLRHRTCTNPAPQNGGIDCPGNGTERKTCQLKLCPVHGGWSSWDNWGTCSATCDVGMRSRKRFCTNPRPQRFGDHCFGDSIEDELCNRGSCAVDGGWNEWNEWGQCSVSCGVGLQSRIRLCTNPSPANAGKQCVGQNFDVKQCYQELCEGEWTDWETWSNCSGTCSQRFQTRKRSCVKHAFTTECQGNSTEIRKCDDTNCYEDCYAIKKNIGQLQSGVYNVRLLNTSRLIPVYCDFDTDTGGWTVFQYRFNGNLDFYRSFSVYERGFGSLHGEFWLGLENIYKMVSQGKTELRLDLTAADGTSVYETFQNFKLGEKPYYTLHIDKGVGTTGLSYHNGKQFSTFDMDRDGTRSNCAISDHGGWWYDNCAYANLNGEYVTPGTQRRSNSEGGMIYYSFRKHESLKISKMMFRRV